MEQGKNISAIQQDKIDRLLPAQSAMQFASQRAMAQYIRVTVGPNVCAAVQLIQSDNKPTTEESFKSLGKAFAFPAKTDTNTSRSSHLT